MTGEMGSINRKGEDSNGNVWNVHAAVARAVKGELKPFDVYQGPYIRVGRAKLWLNTEDGVIAQVYREDTDTISNPFRASNTRAACREARKLLI